MKQTDYEHEIVVTDKGFPFKLARFEGEAGGYYRQKHWHSEVELFALREGALSFELPHRTIRMVPGDVVLVNTNEVHGIRAEVPNVTLFLQIPLEEFSGYYQAEDLIWFSHKNREYNSRAYQLIWGIYRELSGDEPGKELLSRSMFYELLYVLVHYYRKSSLPKDAASQNRYMKKLEPITAYLRKHYNEELSLSSVAQEFGYSDAYLSRMFTKNAGISYKEYLTGLRLDYALREMENQNKTILDIALECGFSGSKPFSSAFLKRFGVLPSQYRKNL